MSKSLEALEVIECILSNHQTMLEAKDKRFEFINIIKQDLERLEHYDNILTENLLAVEHLELTHSELVDLVGDYQIQSKKILEQNKQLEKENQILKEEKFNQYLFLNGEIDKRQKAIEILKDSLHLGIDFYDYDYDYKFVVKVGGLFEHISSEEYELLKEVLKDE